MALPLCVVSAQDAPEEQPDAGLSDDYTFFHQSGIVREQVLGDYDACRELASGVKPPEGPYVYSNNAIGQATTSFLKGMSQGRMRRHMFGAAMRKCMSVKGYKRLMTTKEDATQLYKGGWAEMRERLADRAVAPAGSAQEIEP